MADAMPTNRLSPSTLETGYTSTTHDCLIAAQEAVSLALQAESKGDMERVRLWIEEAHDWLDQAERRTK